MARRGGGGGGGRGEAQGVGHLWWWWRGEEHHGVGPGVSEEVAGETRPATDGGVSTWSVKNHRWDRWRISGKLRCLGHLQTIGSHSLGRRSPWATRRAERWLITDGCRTPDRLPGPVSAGVLRHSPTPSVVLSAAGGGGTVSNGRGGRACTEKESCHAPIPPAARVVTRRLPSPRPRGTPRTARTPTRAPSVVVHAHT